MNKKGKNIKEQMLEGVIRLTSFGVGYLIGEDGENIEIRNKDLNTALHQDKVLVSVYKKNGKLYGNVVKIIQRRKNQHVCTLKKSGESYFCIPQDDKMYVDILVPKRFVNNAKSGEKVVVKIKSWKKHDKNPVGEVIKRLGKPLEHDTEIQAILYDKNIVVDFPAQVLKEAKEVRKYLKDAYSDDRKDMREVVTFTIDPEDAKDFDDALSIKELENKDFEVGIHIADVSFFVRPNTELDKEAAKRGTSIYLVDRTIPMLPPELSNDLCSLNPNEDKLAFSAVFTMDINGTIKKEWFGKTIIHSNKRFSYEDAQDVLGKKTGEYYKELWTLNKISKKLREKKFSAGAINFKDTEVKFVLDDNKKPIAIIEKKQLETHSLIEDFMLLANRRVTEYVERLAKKSNIPKEFVYRVHDVPDPEKIKKLIYILKSLGYNIRVDSPITSEDINRILHAVRGKPEESLIQKAAIKSMAKAVYTTKNIGHFGLAFPFYTHFTSPIRRYPDIMVHRLLYKHLKNEKVDKKEWEKYIRLAEHCSQMEKIAEEAERESVKFKQTEYMKDHVGEVFEGIISGVTPWGLYVEEKKTKSEGLVGIRTLKDDIYEFNEKEYALIGAKTGKKYQLGDTVKIKVKNVNILKKQIDYILYE